jgi:hypothetical protein
LSQTSMQPHRPVSLHAGFLALLARIQTHARIHFRHVRCPGRRDDLVAEAVAISWNRGCFCPGAASTAKRRRCEVTP